MSDHPPCAHCGLPRESHQEDVGPGGIMSPALFCRPQLTYRPRTVVPLIHERGPRKPGWGQE